MRKDNMEFSHDNVKPYEEGTNSKKAEVAKMFDNIAPKYDLLNRVLSLGIDKLWRKKAIKLLGTDQPKQVLDVATGTADVAIEIARQLPDAQITGVDISKEMLAFGDEKLEKLNLTDQINLKLGDSEKLGFEDNTFDAVSVAFGVRNFENLVQGITEIHRVLKPGSKVVILEFSKPRIFPFRQIYNGYFKYILPAIGRLSSKDPKAYRYLYESVQAFPDGDAFLDVLQKIGFQNNRNLPLSLGICSIYVGEKSA